MSTTSYYTSRPHKQSSYAQRKEIIAKLQILLSIMSNVLGFVIAWYFMWSIYSYPSSVALLLIVFLMGSVISTLIDKESLSVHEEHWHKRGELYILLPSVLLYITAFLTLHLATEISIEGITLTWHILTYIAIMSLIISTIIGGTLLKLWKVKEQKTYKK